MMTNFKKERKKKSYTQDEISEKLGIPKTTYCGYEQGIRKIPIEVLCNLADIYQISLDELVGRNFAKAGTELEDEILKYVRQLSLLEQGKVLGYAKARAEAQSEIKDIKIKTGYRG